MSITEAKLVLQQGPDPGHEFPLTKETIVLGRDPQQGADVVIASPMVSRRHASLNQQGNQWFIQDLGSSNGTFINGQRIGQTPTALNPGDQIQLSPSITLIYKTVIPDESKPVQPEAESPATVLDADFVMPEITTPPDLTITIAGQEPHTYTLTKDTYTIGRSEDNDFAIKSNIVSRHHARLERQDSGYVFMTLPEATNPVFYEGRKLQTSHRLGHADILRIGGVEDAGAMVSISYTSPDEADLKRESITVQFGESNVIHIGRDASNDVVLESPSVSRYHAQIDKVGQRYRVNDLRSSNGTFVNDQRIEEEVWLQPQDNIRIGQYRFVMGEDRLDQFDESSGLRADAIGLNKWVRKDLNILQDISVTFQPREFIVIVGQSGGGKSTLLDAIAGYRPATHGTVMVNEIDVYHNFDAVRHNIGYVPQKDIIHMELTAYEALDFAAQLRMPKDTSKEERHQRVMEVLEDLDLAHRKDVKVSGLSGGQQKRVSIGVELLTSPGLFFLDEPTSGLDPGTETSLMQLMRRLADQGRTIVLVTHATKNVMLADKVLFMARGGYLAWFGPPDEALQYFDQYRSERDRRAGPMEFDQIYAILDDSSRGSAEEWAQRYRMHPAYNTHVLQPLQTRYPTFTADQVVAQPQTAPKAAPAKPQKGASSLSQFIILSKRNFKILSRDRMSMILMLVAAPLVAMLDVLIAFMVGNNLYDYDEGNVANLLMTFFLLIIFAAFIGALSQMREIVKEGEIYKRERLVNLKIMPYVASKFWIAALLALYHALAYTVIHYLAYEMPYGVLEFLLIYVTMVLLAMGGMMLGLFASALAPSPNTVPMLVILLIMPMIVLSGALVPLPGPVSYPAFTRWAFEGFLIATGLGSDVAADDCWQLPEELRDEIDIDTKTAQCNCMGLNVLDPEKCNFPGIGEFYDEAAFAPKPIEPPALRDEPAEPDLPPRPEKPEDQSDMVAMTAYSEEMEIYEEDVTALTDNYKADMKLFRAESEVYQEQMKVYQEDSIEWELTRKAAVDPAEAIIDSVYGEYGWAFVNKEDPGEFWPRMFRTWIAMVIIIVVLLGGTLLMVKRKDANK